jgi:hypothetical protein
MARRRLLAVAFLLVMALVAVTGAESASILENAYQICQVVSPSGNSGIFPISGMMVVSPTGVQAPISAPLPENWEFILTRVIWNFIATDTTLTGPLQLNVGDYYRLNAQSTSGFAAAMDGFAPGIPIVNLGATVFVQRFGDATNTPIPGKLNLRLMGYLANIN